VFGERELMMPWKYFSGPLLVKRRNTTSQIASVGADICPTESLEYE
jgi:chloride channel 7